MKSASLVNLSTPFSFASIDRGSGDNKHSDLESYLDVKKSPFDKRVQIWDWIESMEDGATIEQILNSIIKIKKEQKKGRDLRRCKGRDYRIKGDNAGFVRSGSIWGIEKEGTAHAQI